MKEAIHPHYKTARIVCNCGNVIETRSTRGDFHIEICSSCHPFFTGKQKILDTAGRIERFRTRYQAVAGEAAPKKAEPLPPPPTIILKNSSWFFTCRNLSRMNFIASTLSRPFRMVWRRM